MILGNYFYVDFYNRINLCFCTVATKATGDENMGVDTRLTLPPAAEISDVAKAIALLLGKTKAWVSINHSNRTQHGLAEPTEHGWVETEGITYSVNNHQPNCATMNIAEIPELYGDGWLFFYHFEFGNGGNRGMLGGSRAVRIALHRRIVDIFGGTVDYQDCDSKDVDYNRKSPAWLGKSNDDKAFHAKQLALWNIKPIAKDEIDACEKFAAYKNRCD
jgi:hypothetical protein